MKPAVIVLLLVARGDMQQPAMVALTGAAETVLGPQSHILVHERSKSLSDEEAIALADQMRASMVVAVTWSDDRSRAHVHVHFSDRSGWLERDLAFTATDPATERGRTLGYEIATMVPDLPPPVPPAPKPAPARPEAPTAPPKAAPSPPPRWAVDFDGVGVVGGDATAYGIGAGGRWAFAGPAFVRAGGSVLFGRVLDASATSLTVAPALGVGFSVEALPRRLRVGARADGLAIFTDLSRDTPPESRGRWTPGVDLLGEVEVAVSPIAFAASAGAEYALGTTVVRIGDADTATLPRLRFVGEVGLRWRF